MDWRPEQICTPPFQALTSVGAEVSTSWSQCVATYNNLIPNEGFADDDFYNSLPCFGGDWAETPRQPDGRTGTFSHGAVMYTSQAMIEQLPFSSPFGTSCVLDQVTGGVRSDGLSENNDLAAPPRASYDAHAGSAHLYQRSIAPQFAQPDAVPSWQRARPSHFSVPSLPWPWCHIPLQLPVPPLGGDTYAPCIALPAGQTSLMLCQDPQSSIPLPNRFESDKLLAEIEAAPWPNFHGSYAATAAVASTPIASPLQASGAYVLCTYAPEVARSSRSASAAGLLSHSAPATPGLPTDHGGLISLETLASQPLQAPQPQPEDRYMGSLSGRRPPELPLLPPLQALPPLQPQLAAPVPLPQPVSLFHGLPQPQPVIQPMGLPPSMSNAASDAPAVLAAVPVAHSYGCVPCPRGYVTTSPAGLNPSPVISSILGSGPSASLPVAVAMTVPTPMAAPGGVEQLPCGPAGAGIVRDAGTVAAVTTMVAATACAAVMGQVMPPGVRTLALPSGSAPSIMVGVEQSLDDPGAGDDGTAAAADGGPAASERRSGGSRGRGRKTSSINADGSSGRITLEALRSMFDMPVQEVVRSLNISATDLKRRCRALGIQRWPQRKLVSLRRLAGAVETDKGLGEEQRQEILSLVARNRAQILEHPDTELECCLKPLRQVHYKRSFVDRHGISKF